MECRFQLVTREERNSGNGRFGRNNKWANNQSYWQSYWRLFGYKAIGMYRTEADLQRTNSKGEIIKQNGVAPKLGDIMYADLNDDGNITADDRDIIGNPFPKYSYSFKF